MIEVACASWFGVNALIVCMICLSEWSAGRTVRWWIVVAAILALPFVAVAWQFWKAIYYPRS